MSCGVPGTWAITWKLGGANYSANISGFSLDNPYYQSLGSQQGCSNYGVILSACDGRNLAPPRFSCSTFPTNFTFTFTPDNPNDIPHDCMNGKCVPSAQHNGEGLYSTLAECEANCGSGSICNGECVSSAKISQLKNLANRLKRKNCGC